MVSIPCFDFCINAAGRFGLALLVDIDIAKDLMGVVIARGWIRFICIMSEPEVDTLRLTPDSISY